MADIINTLTTPSNLVIVSSKTRARRFSVENTAQNPDGSMPADVTGHTRSILFEVEDRDLLSNGFYAPTPPRMRAALTRQLTMDVLRQTKTVFDPFVRMNLTMSVAGCAKLIEEFFSSWWVEDLARAQAQAQREPEDS